MSEEFHKLTALFNKAINETDALMQAAITKTELAKNPGKSGSVKVQAEREAKMHEVLKAARFAWQFKVHPHAMALLKVKSDDKMTVHQWIEINYPQITIIDHDTGFAG